jgi:hypothetical protein
VFKVKKPHFNITFIQLTIPTLLSTTVNVYANEFQKTKYFKNVEYVKITILEVRVRVIEGYDPV